MDQVTLTTETRLETGKGANRRLRARGLIPGVFYGKGTDAVGLAITPKALMQALATPHRRNALLKLQVAGGDHLAMIKELQVHPVTREVLHVDLYKVQLEQPVHARVPFFTEGRAKGVIAGGELTIVFRELPVRTTPDNIPAALQVDVTNMELGDSLRVKDLQLPPGVEVTLDPERSLVSCAEPRKLPVEEEPGQAAPTAEGAAPAAAGAAAPGQAKPAS